MPPDDALAEFASTYREWHYFVGGVSIGVVAGIALALWWAVAYREATDDWRTN
jgi:hypothetical protein